MRYLVIILFQLVFLGAFCQTKQQLDSLTRVLEKTGVEGQKYRLAWDSTMQQHGINSNEFTDLIKKMNFQDSLNMITVASILDRFGWLSKEQTSAEASDALFLVIQHASLEYQIKYLPLMKQAVADKKARAADFAILADRTNMYRGKLQVYGSQVNYDKGGHIHIFPIIDEPNVNKRRNAIGLPPMQTYLNLFNQNISYSLPKKDRYKNKLVIEGSVMDKHKNQPAADVYIYSGNGTLLAKSDSNGFFQIVLAQKDRPYVIYFKKDDFDTVNYNLVDDTKDVEELNVNIAKK